MTHPVVRGIRPIRPRASVGADAHHIAGLDERQGRHSILHEDLGVVMGSMIVVRVTRVHGISIEGPAGLDLGEEKAFEGRGAFRRVGAILRGGRPYDIIVDNICFVRLSPVFHDGL